MIALAGVFVVLLIPQVASPQPPGGRGFRPPLHPLMEALDADKNGELSAKEIEGIEALKTLDKNQDGKLDGDELRPRFGGRRPGGRPRPGGVAVFNSEVIPKDDAEKKILDVLDDMDRNQRGGMMNVPKADGRLLRLLTETVGAKHVVEIGTSNGYSGIWFCLALRTTGGKLTTYEIDERRAALARENFKRAGVDQLVTLVLGDAHKEVTKLEGQIDILFLDADKAGYVDYLKKLLPKVRPGGLIVAHNMNTRMADPNYVKAITTNKDLETIFLHMQGAGVGVSLKKR